MSAFLFYIDAENKAKGDGIVFASIAFAAANAACSVMCEVALSAQVSHLGPQTLLARMTASPLQATDCDITIPLVRGPP